MKKGTYRLLAALWILAFVITRIVYYIYCNQTVADTYGYYAHAMIRQDRASEVLSSGMAYAYVGNLSGILAFLGNRMELLGIYQMLLQIAWMLFLFLGAGLIWGRIAQMLTGTILAVSPWILESVFVVSPENYFMLFFSLFLFLLGLCVGTAEKNSSLENSFWKLVLALTAFGTGVICTWNYLGWLLLPVGIYALVKNKKRLSDIVTFTAGMLLGVCATLLKYTSLTGLSLKEQFFWWIEPLGALPRRCQDLSIQMAVWLVFAGVAGVLIAMAAEGIKQKKVHNEEEEKAAPDEKPSDESKPADYTITEDGRKIALLENPLPLPKKHERRKMDFKYNELPKESDKGIKEWADQAADGLAFDDFDVSISENDDFDV